MRRCKISDSAMEMKPELATQLLVGDANPVLKASFFKQSQIELVMLTREDWPAHLDITVRWNVNWRRWRSFPQ